VRRGLILFALGSLVVVGLLAHIDPPHSREPEPLQVDAALVMSGDVDYRRLEKGIALVKSGAAPSLVLTGAGAGGDSAATMRELAVKAGVAPDHILTENVARSTRENVVFAARLLKERGFRRVALITNASHLGRSERVARQAVPDIDWVPVAVADPGPRSRVYRTRLQEWVKLAWYLARRWI
jgi:uncharacterized SAM-binding protein YcdF (DUF218 family)